jgi:hypothetical protein
LPNRLVRLGKAAAASLCGVCQCGLGAGGAVPGEAVVAAWGSGAVNGVVDAAFDPAPVFEATEDAVHGAVRDGGLFGQVEAVAFMIGMVE